MAPTRNKLFYGWVVVWVSALVVFGVAGSQFSFGVFLKPMAEHFHWSRTTLATAFAVTFLLLGLMLPLVGYLADRYSPKAVALSGVALVGGMLLLLPLVRNLAQLYLIFAFLSVGLTLAASPTLTKIVGAWFRQKRGMALAVVVAGGSMGGTVLVPLASGVLELASWQTAFRALAGLLLLLVLPVGLIFLKNRPQDMGLQPAGEPPPSATDDTGPSACVPGLPDADATFHQALGTPLFWRLAFGSLV